MQLPPNLKLNASISCFIKTVCCYKTALDIKAEPQARYFHHTYYYFHFFHFALQSEKSDVPLLSYHHFAITLQSKVKKVKEVICVIALLAMRYRVKAPLLSITLPSLSLESEKSERVKDMKELMM
jgi:hypothetical protein